MEHSSKAAISNVFPVVSVVLSVVSGPITEWPKMWHVFVVVVCFWLFFLLLFVSLLLGNNKKLGIK